MEDAFTPDELHPTHHLFDRYDRDLGPATWAQVEASDKADYGEQGGFFWIDKYGHPTTLSARPPHDASIQVYTWHS